MKSGGCLPACASTSEKNTRRLLHGRVSGKKDPHYDNDRNRRRRPRFPSLAPAPSAPLIPRCHIHMQEGRHKVPESASKAVRSRMKLNLHATHRTPHGASRMVQAMSCLPGQRKPRYSVTALWGCEGLRSYDYGHARQ